MLFNRRLSFTVSFSVILLIIFQLHETCDASSSCGSLHNISYPFCLLPTSDEAAGVAAGCYSLLRCQNNRTVLDLGLSGEKAPSHYYVEEIFYENFSMRVVDPGIHKHNCSSTPLFLSTPSGYTYDKLFPYMIPPFGSLTPPDVKDIKEPLRPYEVITFVRCPVGVEVNSTIFVDTAPCEDPNNPFATFSLLPTRSYVVRGEFDASDVGDSCVIGMSTLVSNHWVDINFTDFQSIHDGMAYGFELLWYRFHPNCSECARRGGSCYLKNSNEIGCVPAHQNWLRNILWGIEDWLGPLPYCMPYRWTSIQEGALQPLSILVFGLYCTGHAIIARIALAVLCGFPCMFIFLICKWRKRHLSIYNNIEDFLQSQNNFMPIRYSYSQLKKMTRDFKDKVGEGGFGTVYKGKLRSGSDVAVKMLGESKANGQEFINEVATIGRIHHSNVVRLVGFCVEKSKRALVYDFLPNGSLEKHIFSKEAIISISWEKMHEISLGVAYGIDYLHRGCDVQILHFDIKPHNILLDDNLNPQISDFGLAKLCPMNDNIVSLTAARGTMGYMAPELFYKNIGAISNKADVYSFGMMLMEMAARRRNLNTFEDNLSQIYFPSWAYDKLSEGMDLGIGTVPEESHTTKKMIIVALWCIQMNPSDRPSIKKVIEMLEGTVENLQMPPKPFLLPRETPSQPVLSIESTNSIRSDISEN